jgi:hypothetical protein
MVYPGKKLFINEPTSSYHSCDEKSLFCLIMHYLTLQESNIYSKGGNTANFVRLSNFQLASSCWEMVRILVGINQFFMQCMKFDSWYPFAYDYRGKPTDIFLPEVVNGIMALYIPSIKMAIDMCDKTAILSKLSRNMPFVSLERSQ